MERSTTRNPCSGVVIAATLASGSWFEPRGEDLSGDGAEGDEPIGPEWVDQQGAHTLDVRGCRPVEQLPALRCQRGEQAAAIGRTVDAFDDAAPFETVRTRIS